MTKKIVIAGSGFAGMWAAISAARAIALAGKEDEVEVSIVSPSANLAIRPRLYETALEEVNPDIGPLLQAVGVRHITGLVEAIDADARRLAIFHADGTRTELDYDKFVLATGSKLVLCAVMFIGRLGPLTAAYALQRHQKPVRYRLPAATVRIG